jgi:hypothetical protein
MLKPDRKILTKLWWFLYLLISPHCNFEANYMRAWAEDTVDSKKTTIIFVGDEELSVPWLEGDELDKPRLEHLRMFYLVLKLRRDLFEIIVPRTLLRVDWVKVSSAFDTSKHFDSSLLEQQLRLKMHHMSLVSAYELWI